MGYANWSWWVNWAWQPGAVNLSGLDTRRWVDSTGYQVLKDRVGYASKSPRAGWRSWLGYQELVGRVG